MTQRQRTAPDSQTSRSDAIRRRRMQSSHVTHQAETRKRRSPTRAGSSAAGTPPPIPPVMTRRSQPGAAHIDARRSRQSRRRYDVRLNAQGAEMRLPALPLGLAAVRIGWRAASFLMLAFLSAVVYYLWNSPQYRVDAASVSGLKRISNAEVNRLVGATGEPIFALYPRQIERDLLGTFPEFAAAQVAVQLPNSVWITITERTPVLVWQQDGRSNLVDEDGMTFPARDGLPQGMYPVVEAAGNPPGPAPQLAPLDSPEPTLDLELKGDIELPLPAGRARQLLTPEMVKTILAIFQQLPGGAQLIYDPQHGFGWRDQRGWDVFLGELQDMSSKLVVYRGIIEHLETSGLQPVLISVEFAHAPYYRLEP